MQIKHYMITKIDFVAPGDTAVAAAKILREKDIGSLLVKEDGEFVGIVTERDMTRKIVAASKNPEDLVVSDIMSTPLVTIDEEESIIEASRLFKKYHIKRMAVTRDSRIVGVISSRKIVENLKRIIEVLGK